MNNKIVSGFTLISLLATPTVVAHAEVMNLDLPTSIEIGLEHNHVLKQAEIDKDISRSQLREISGKKNLNVNLASKYSKLSGKTNELQIAMQHRKNDKIYGTDLQATLVLYTFGKLENAIKAGHYKVDATDFTYLNAISNTRNEITKAYYAILKYRNLLKVNKDAVAQITAHLQNVNAKYNAGVVAKTDVLRTEVELANAKQNLVNVQNAYNIAQLQLKTLLGIDLKQDIDVADMTTPENESLIELQTALTEALNNRNDIKAVEMLQRAARANVSRAQSGNLPDIAAFANWSRAGSGLMKDDYSQANAVGLNVNWNIFDGNITRSQVQQARLELAKVDQQLALLQDKARLDVEKAYLSIQAARQNMSTTNVAVNRAKEDYNIATVRYNAGVGTNLDVMDARLALTQANTNHVLAMYEYNVAKADLSTAMGE